jgi:predicted lipoprotein
MTSFTRPTSIAAAAAPLLAGLAAARLPLEARIGNTAVSKRAALENIAQGVLLPAYTELAARSSALATAVDALAATPSPASLSRAKEAWSATHLAWRRAQTFAHGPIAELNVYGRIQFWPSRRQSVERVVRAQRPIDDDYIQELGAGAVGLSALEVLLFDARKDDAARLASFAGPNGERQRQYARVLARELASKTQLVLATWRAGFDAGFAAGGQDSVNLIVNDVLAAIESGVQARLRSVIDLHGAAAIGPDLVEGALSGTSQQGILALLVGARAAFSGGDGPGLDDYLRQLNAATARRVEAQFQKAIAAVQAIGGPVELAVAANPDQVRRAHDECRALEIMLKTEVVSSLGVTLTFKATDGD